MKGISRLLLDTLAFLRHQQIKYWLKAGNNRKPLAWIDLDRLLVTKCAIFCDMPATSILSTEKWCEDTFNESTLAASVSESVQGDALHVLQEIEVQPEHERLLLAAYRMMGEEDAISGIRQISSSENRIESAEFEGNWGRALMGKSIASLLF